MVPKPPTKGAAPNSNENGANTTSFISALSGRLDALVTNTVSGNDNTKDTITKDASNKGASATTTTTNGNAATTDPKGNALELNIPPATAEIDLLKIGDPSGKQSPTLNNKNRNKPNWLKKNGIGA
ncbi:hypothetical protein AMATHDRAFT_6798 [Amanita thiersii Skay4041]|uniref:Uncharacterized protein n=1 Tax=Amanita thiersii Skay4041 TaxID=703135 RepID=A0A2A9N909_9AGAR|nr:hypothetical protein AMATHDRAFT_6798 [Amanita thiersii Skay4041]